MELDSAKKAPLSRVTHSVRAAQAVLQYGVGAMVDFPDQTLMTAAPEYWADKTIKIHDERLEKVLHVDYFGMPGSQDEPQFAEGISYVRFPEWYFCPKCRRFQPIQKWIQEYQRKASEKTRENDPYMVKHMRCQTCKQDLVVARVITVCEHGHIDDFPWVKWVHRRSAGGAKQVCPNPSLTFKTGASSSEGLEGLVITCEACHAKATLKDAFDPKIFASLDEKSNNYEFICTGKHPWKHTKEKCTQHPRSMQRGSSSVYFPVTASSLVIPPFSDILNTKIENSHAFQECRTTLSNIPQDLRGRVIQIQIDTWAHTIGMEIGAKDSLVKSVLLRKWCAASNENYNTLSIKYRAEEYDALNGSADFSIVESKDFLRESIDVTQYDIPCIKGVSLIHKIREVQALTGFTRLKPAEWSEQIQSGTEFVSIKQPETNWYPAYEIRGEGIFIEFNQELIARWAEDNMELVTRVADLNKNYSNSFMGQNRIRNITGKFLLLHTISHLLIKQLSFECGYSIASLRERLYCSELRDGKEMAGVLIYTASGDSEGTLGGLVRQGRPDSLGRIFKKAIESAMTCSNDPVCILSKGQGRDSLNLAACHSCTLIPETSCEEYNTFLDRGVVVGTFENKELGFFCREFDKGVSAVSIIASGKSLNKKGETTNSETIFVINNGINMEEESYLGIWQYVVDSIENIHTSEQCLFDNLIAISNDLAGCEKPFYGETVRLLTTNEQIQVDLIWKKAQVMLFVSDNEENYLKVKESGWKCFYAAQEGITAEMIVESIKGN